MGKSQKPHLEGAEEVGLAEDAEKPVPIAQLRQVLYAKKPGEAVTLKVWRQGRTLTLRVVPQVLR